MVDDYVYDYNCSKLIRIGDMVESDITGSSGGTKEVGIDLFGSELPKVGLPKTSIVHTSMGHVTIEEIFAHLDLIPGINPSVLTDLDGEVELLNSYGGWEPLSEIVINGYEIITSITLSDGTVLNSTPSLVYTVTRDGEKVAARAEEIRLGDRLDEAKLNVGTIGVEGDSIIATDEQLYVLGVMLGRGYAVVEGYITFSARLDDKLSKVEEFFGATEWNVVDLMPQTDKNLGVPNNANNEPNIMALYRSWGIHPQTIQKRTVPLVIRRNRSMQPAFVAGAMESNWFVDNRHGGVSLHSRFESYDLALGVKLLMANLGVKSVIVKQELFPGANEFYFDLCIVAESIPNYIDSVGIYDPELMSALDNSDIIGFHTIEPNVVTEVVSSEQVATYGLRLSSGQGFSTAGYLVSGDVVE